MQGADTASSLVPELITELTEAWNAHDLERVIACYAHDYMGEDVSQPVPLRGREALRANFERYLAAFPDLRFTNEQVIAQGNRVAVLWTARGTHAGSIMRIPATHKPVEVRGTSLLTVRDNKVQYGVHIWDLAALLREIGLLPDL